MTQIIPTPVCQKRPKMLRSKKHRDYVASFPCVVHTQGLRRDQYPGQSTACHVNYLGAKHGKPRGMSEKVDDIWTVPMCDPCHKRQSDDGQSGQVETHWWAIRYLDPEPICIELAKNSPDPEIRKAVEDL